MMSMFIALALTILIETPIAWALGYRSRNEIITVILASVITNPPLNFIIAICAALKFTACAPLVLVLEAAVVIAEWRILLYALGGYSRRHFKTSLIINAASYLSGFLFF
jgi:hypothetical protein